MATQSLAFVAFTNKLPRKWTESSYKEDLQSTSIHIFPTLTTCCNINESSGPKMQRQTPKLLERELERDRKSFFKDCFQPLDELIHFMRSLNGDVIMSTFIPNPPDHDQGCGYATANKGKTMARKLLFQINYEILKRNRTSLYKNKGLLNPAKYFYGKPSRRELYKDELGKVIPFYKINKKSYIKNSTSPTKRLSYTKNFLLVSTALKIAGWGRFSHEDYDTLLKECNLHNLTKERTGIEVVENITQ